MMSASGFSVKVYSPAFLTNQLPNQKSGGSGTGAQVCLLDAGHMNYGNNGNGKNGNGKNGNGKLGNGKKGNR